MGRLVGDEKEAFLAGRRQNRGRDWPPPLDPTLVLGLKALHGASPVCTCNLAGTDSRSSIEQAGALLREMGRMSPFPKEISSLLGSGTGSGRRHLELSLLCWIGLGPEFHRERAGYKGNKISEVMGALGESPLLEPMVPPPSIDPWRPPLSLVLMVQELAQSAGLSDGEALDSSAWLILMQ